MSRKENFFRKSIFIGAGLISLGSTRVDAEGKLSFRGMQRYLKPYIPIMRARDLSEFYCGEFKYYDPHSGDNTGETVKVFFFDLQDGNEFSYKDSSPAELMLRIQTLQAEKKELQNMIQFYQDTLKAKGIKDFRNREIQQDVEIARKIAFSSNQSPMQQPNK
jgi:hypothetical protein